MAASSSVSDFLKEKIAQLASEQDMLIAYKEGLFETREKEMTSSKKSSKKLLT